MGRALSKTIAALLCVPAFSVLILAGGAPLAASAKSASAVPLASSGYLIENFEVEMDVRSDRTVAVSERFTVFFRGGALHGVIRDFPLEEGVRYRDFSCESSSADFSPHFERDDLRLLSLYLDGNSVLTGKERTYSVNYVMEVPALNDEGYLPLNVFMYGGSSETGEVRATVTFPERLTAEPQLFSGRSGSTGNDANVELSRAEGAVTLYAADLSAGEGITLDLHFEEGFFSSRFDVPLFTILMIGFGLLALTIAAKLFLCRQPIITTTVNFSAPDEMDPLLMGKIIDNKVDSEDLGAAVFYLADRGFLKIDLADEDDPALIAEIKEESELPENIRILYDGLFASRRQVRVSELNNTFYKTARAAKESTEVRAGRAFSARSKGFMAVFCALAVCLIGGFAFFYSFFTVTEGAFRYFLDYPVILSALLACVLSAAGNCIAKQRSLKWSRKKTIALSVGSPLLSMLLALLLFVPSPAYGWGVRIPLVCFPALIGAIAGHMLVRDKTSCARLGQILGFRQFLLYTEKDRIAFLVQDNPELYYHILPYAQVLGLTDVWTDKFEGLDVAPPSYVSNGGFDLFDVLLFHSMFRHINVSLSRTMVSRPSSSSYGGSHGGGFGGGFGGGGFGGGGMRGC